MCPSHSDRKLTLQAERLHFNLLYCRADAEHFGMSYVAHLLNLACEEMQKLADADANSVTVQPDWNAFHVYPGMK